MLIAHPPAGDILAKTRTTTTRPLIGLVLPASILLYRRNR